MAKKLIIVQNNDVSTTSTINNSAKEVSLNNDVVLDNFDIGLEDNDKAVVHHITNTIKPRVFQNNLSIEVPVQIGNRELWESIQYNGYYRDKNSELLFPIIVLNRSNVERNREYINKIDPLFPQTNFIIETKYNKRNSYDKFSILNNVIPQKEIHVVQVPDYLTITYDVFIVTNFFEHMNHLVEQFLYANNSYWGDEKYKFKVMIENISNSTEFSVGEERLIRNEFSIKLNGYILPKVIQKDLNKIGKYNSKSKFVIKSEFVTTL